MKNQKYDGTIKRVGVGRIELLEVTMNVSQKERKAFIKDPEAFMTKFMRAHGRVVNGMIGDPKLLQKLVKKAKSTGPSRPITPLTVMKAHVYSPPEHKSVHITISGTTKK